jgi:hypothetical protein
MGQLSVVRWCAENFVLGALSFVVNFIEGSAVVQEMQGTKYQAQSTAMDN